MKIEKGIFISFEGGEATGKTTQINRIKNWLILNKLPYLITREPGGTIIGESLRKIILSPRFNIDTNIEVFLLMASRLDHLTKVIIPSLKKGKIVLCDRYVDSTAVYQGYVKKFGIKNIYKLHKNYLYNIIPKLTFYFYTNSKIIHLRLAKRKNKNKYDLIDRNFNNKIHNGYLKISKNNKRFKIINASLSKNDISKMIIKNITDLLVKYEKRISKKN